MCFFQALANVLRGKPGPHHIGDVGRAVIEHVDGNALVVRAHKTRVGRAQAGSDNSQALISLRLEPVETRANVDHRLARSIQRPADIGGDRVVGAIEFGRHAVVVIRQADSERRNSQPGQPPAQREVAIGRTVPMRKHHYGFLRPPAPETIARGPDCSQDTACGPANGIAACHRAARNRPASHSRRTRRYPASRAD